MKYLLDTHVWLWALYEPRELSPAVRALLQRTGVVLYVSYAALWEALDKAGKGRLPMAGNSPSSILSDLRKMGVTFLPVTEDDILASVSLPLHYGDPFDRMMIAQAVEHDLTFVTKDDKIYQYDVRVLWN